MSARSAFPHLSFLCTFLVLLCNSHVRAETTSNADFQDSSQTNEFAFLQSMSIEVPEPEWTFLFEVNNTGTAEHSDRERISAEKYEWLAEADYLILDYETDHFQSYYGLYGHYSHGLAGGSLRAEWDFFQARNELSLSDTSFETEDIGRGYGGFLLKEIFSENELLTFGVGARVQTVSIDQSEAFQNEDNNRFFLWGLKASYAFYSPQTLVSLSFLLEKNSASIADTKPIEQQDVFTYEVDPEFKVMSWFFDFQWSPQTMADATFLFKASGGGQNSFKDRLYPQSQKTLGGLNSVRGYDDDVVSGDDALWYRIEPTFLLAKTSNTKQWLSVFYDYGKVKNKTVDLSRFPPFFAEIIARVLPPESLTLRSVGVGYEWEYSTHTGLYLAYGKALEDDDVSTEKGDSQIHARLKFQF